jgi:hypothetical protein
MSINTMTDPISGAVFAFPLMSYPVGLLEKGKRKEIHQQKGIFEKAKRKKRQGQE